jgi:hypothetical protein
VGARLFIESFPKDQKCGMKLPDLEDVNVTNKTKQKKLPSFIDKYCKNHSSKPYKKKVYNRILKFNLRFLQAWYLYEVGIASCHATLVGYLSLS